MVSPDPIRKSSWPLGREIALPTLLGVALEPELARADDAHEPEPGVLDRGVEDGDRAQEPPGAVGELAASRARGLERLEGLDLERRVEPAEGDPRVEPECLRDAGVRAHDAVVLGRIAVGVADRDAQDDLALGPASIGRLDADRAPVTGPDQPADAEIDDGQFDFARAPYGRGVLLRGHGGRGGRERKQGAE